MFRISIDVCFVIAGIVSALPLLHRQLLQYTRYLQQDTYYPGRYLKWVIARRKFHLQTVVWVAVLACLTWLSPSGALLALPGFAFAYWLSDDPYKDGKLPLILTERAKRIVALACVIPTGLATVALFLAGSWFAWLPIAAAFLTLPVYPALAVVLLAPDERRRQSHFKQEAVSTLQTVRPLVVGITGSYGKTSTKELLGQLLQAACGPTFWPPKGVNTEMGITRSIRETLRSHTQYAVIEMAAYGKGSIRKLCQLTPPQAAIVTCVGHAHLERFGSTANILEAKSELALALPPDSLLVCNGDNDGARSIARLRKDLKVRLYGLDSAYEMDCFATDIRIDEKGTACQVHWKGRRYPVHFPQWGKPALSNLLGAFTMACELGADPAYVAAVAGTLNPVDNRLQLKREGDLRVLHDAYNSNPIGFASALDVLQALPAKRRIVMTPGMIELGELQESLNRKLAQQAAHVCDLAIVVGPTNRQALKSGLSAGGLRDDQVLVCENRTEAFHRFAALKQPGDLLLIENDLPDLYEKG